ncbi:hypothetical protein GCM10010917_38780 [Paenibacillus physcomitrellae]|uniref:Uncharacterized protein n=1 Tax=Paenibacillus physcomitrellae TaxID=1619311 RepID=A0ABQ1GTF8_9BACL|nr:hypothetical protein GCM10010917_38780 [Paenibacillus physcomitrellae]
MDLIQIASIFQKNFYLSPGNDNSTKESLYPLPAFKAFANEKDRLAAGLFSLSEIPSREPSQQIINITLTDREARQGRIEQQEQ